MTYCFHPSVNSRNVQISNMFFFQITESLQVFIFKWWMTHFGKLTSPQLGGMILPYIVTCFGLFAEIMNMLFKDVHYPNCPKMIIPLKQCIWIPQWKDYTFWVVGEDEKVHTGGTGSRAKDGDSLWVSSKVANVFIKPAQGLDLVQQAIVPLSRLVPCAQKPCRVN